MDHPESRIAPSPEAESDDYVSPAHVSEIGGPAGPAPPEEADDALYWRGVADGLARAGIAVPPDVAARAGAAPPGDPADILAFEPVPLRHRDDGLTPEKQRAYVEALADCGVAREAAARIGVSERSIARVRRRSDARSFDRACVAARRFGARRLHCVAWERAIEGTLKGHYYHGERISEERVYDNRLLIYLLGKTEHLAEPADEETRIVCDNWEPFMDALERGLPPPPVADDEEADGPDEDLSEEQVWEEDGVWWTLFPPPEDFDGEEQDKLGDHDYQRTLTADEEAALRSKRRALDDGELARCCAVRDRFFGLPPRGAPGFSLPREAGLSGPSAAPAPAAPVEQSCDCAQIAPHTHSEGGSG